MASFVEIDENNVVLRGVVVYDKDTADENGVEQESIGAAFLHQLLGGTWKQTSYNARIRKNFAGIGYTYDAARDAFIPPRPSADATLDEATCQWIVPAIELSLGADSSESGDSI